MDPTDFLSREEFERLSEEDAERYTEDVAAGFVSAEGAGDEERLVSFAIHQLDLAEWTLPAEEYERLIREPLWDAAWANAQTFRESLEQHLASAELTAAERSRVLALVEHARTIEEHKRSLEELG